MPKAPRIHWDQSFIHWSHTKGSKNPRKNPRKAKWTSSKDKAACKLSDNRLTKAITPTPTWWSFLLQNSKEWGVKPWFSPKKNNFKEREFMTSKNRSSFLPLLPKRRECSELLRPKRRMYRSHFRKSKREKRSSKSFKKPMIWETRIEMTLKKWIKWLCMPRLLPSGTNNSYKRKQSVNDISRRRNKRTSWSKSTVSRLSRSPRNN